ncbi:hypothetical protein [Corallococcus sp. AS-1-12]|uniref:hypothetical protein n=1 Tax=Corallococcus sp. AS-1-12 TaxID=2874598 RepID=UPI001CBE2588|nr:hypothetical protein [Corallococcus sp. AS-1-12]MBZ4333411.1 hypothetical protein [Corallococcus sp. AS-1-12]
MTTTRWKDAGAVGLGALLLGLLIAPWVYVVAFNALFAFPSPFAMMVAPLLLVATLDLGLEAFARLHGFMWLRRLGSTLSVGGLLMILWVLSGFTLMPGPERLGLLATVWLGTSLTCLVIVLAVGASGPTRLLRSRLDTPARQRAALALALLLFGGLSALCLHYLLTPVSFIGGPPSPVPIG